MIGSFSFCTYAGDIGKKIHIQLCRQLISVRLFAISKDAIGVSAYHYADKRNRYSTEP
jgi:hypothetical protein